MKKELAEKIATATHLYKPILILVIISAIVLHVSGIANVTNLLNNTVLGPIACVLILGSMILSILAKRQVRK